MRVSPGCERLLEEARRLLGGCRYALCAHRASVTSRGEPVAQRLSADPTTRPQFIFVPEHGLYGEQAYMEPVSDYVDPHLGVPVVSLYGSSPSSLAPSEDLLRGLDAVVFDLQDIGSRYYTYLATMAMTMEACARAGVRFVVCDRPNPVGLSVMEGGRVRPHLRSFVSYLDVPVRHGLTAGEAARLHAASANLDLDLLVLECEGLSRKALWPDLGLPFVPPSPNIPDFETALLYPGMCLLEGTNASEGRGTTTPFKVFGAPYILDPYALAARLNDFGLPGVAFHPLFFRPWCDKGAGERCGGVQVLVLDRSRLRPFLTGLAVLRALMDIAPNGFSYRRDAYEFVEDRLALDLLLGDESLRAALEQGADPRDLAASLIPTEREFQEARKPFLLYPD